MKTIHPYLVFNGNAEEAFTFYQSVFGGEFQSIERFRNIPGMENIPPELKDKIMHIALPIDNGILLMASDTFEALGNKLIVGNNFNIYVELDSKEEADKLYDKLSVGGKIEMPIADTFWGAYYGAFADQFGVKWMISHTYKKE